LGVFGANMKYYKTISVKIIEKVKCDKCGFETDGDDMEEFLFIDFTGGYNSVFGDMNKVECDICQNCLKALVGSYCRIKEYGE